MNDIADQEVNWAAHSKRTMYHALTPKDLESFLQAHANRPPDAPDPSCDGSAGDAILPRDKPR